MGSSHANRRHHHHHPSSNHHHPSSNHLLIPEWKNSRIPHRRSSSHDPSKRISSGNGAAPTVSHSGNGKAHEITRRDEVTEAEPPSPRLDWMGRIKGDGRARLSVMSLLGKMLSCKTIEGVAVVEPRRRASAKVTDDCRRPYHDDIASMDPPLPVVRRDLEEENNKTALWKRRKWEGLAELQLQQINTPECFA